MVYKPPGQFFDNFMEQLRNNPTAFSNVAGQCSDDWFTNAQQSGIPTRPGRTRDVTGYPANPQTDSWNARINGTLSPARPGGFTGSSEQGSIP